MTVVLYQSILPKNFGAIAQSEERLICIQEVVGSIPSGSTSLGGCFGWLARGNELEAVAPKVEGG